MEKILQQEEKNVILEKFQNQKVINKSLEIKGIKKYNLNGDLMYNIDNIKIECEKREGINLIKYICFILNENREDLIVGFYQHLGKDFLLGKFYETLEIENKGGIYKKIPNKKKDENEIFLIEDQERKTSGGVLFSLLKQDKESKLIYKKITKNDFKERNNRKKTYKLLKKLAL
jgi:hypothetical protein